MENSLRKKNKSNNSEYARQLENHLTKSGPKSGDGSPTEQRVARAKGNNQNIRANVIHNESGFPTSNFYWRITPILDTLHARKTITDEEYNTALRYMRHYAGSKHKGPATSKMLPRYDCDMRDMDAVDRAMEMGQRRALAEKAVHPFFRGALRWLEQAAEDERPLWHLGAAYYPDLSQSQQSQKASVILHFALGMLAQHYGTPHRFTQSELEMAVETVRMTIEVKRVIHSERKKMS